MSTLPLGDGSSVTGAGVLTGNGVSRFYGDAYLRESPDTHHMRAWGSPVVLSAYLGDIGAGVAITTFQKTGVIVNPFPYAYLYDVVFTCTAHEAAPAAATNLLDVFDTNAAGSASANSYFSATPFTIALGLASGFRTKSSRFAATGTYVKDFDPSLYAGYPGSLGKWKGSSYTAGTRSIPFLIPQGQIFSVRAATTAATGALTGVRVDVILVPFDQPGLIDR